MCHSTIKMNPVDTRCTIYIDFNVENNDKNPKFNVGDHVRISKYKNIFGKVYAPSSSEEIFVIKKDEITVPRTYNVSTLNSEEIVQTFYKKSS